MIRGLVYVGITFFLVWMLIDFIHYVAREDRNYFESDEYKRYCYKTLKEALRRVREEDEKKR